MNLSQPPNSPGKRVLKTQGNSIEGVNLSFEVSSNSAQADRIEYFRPPLSLRDELNQVMVEGEWYSAANVAALVDQRRRGLPEPAPSEDVSGFLRLQVKSKLEALVGEGTERDSSSPQRPKYRRTALLARPPWQF